MIRNIKLLKNIGTFDSDNAAASLDLKRLVLVYGENGRGKTTLTAALRSLSTGSGLPVAERRRLGSQHTPYIVLKCDGAPANVIFQDGDWNRTLPDLKVFDDVFVDENVYSGLDVDSQHRQNLHELILGDQGVKLNQRLQCLVSCIDQHNIALDAKSKLIPEQQRGGLSFDEFCALPELPNVEAQIEKVTRALTAARDQDAVKSSSLFSMIELPEFDVEAISHLLKTDLADLDRTAEAQVKAHVQVLGKSGESWIAAGMRHLTQGDDGICPFCGQDIAGLDLITHYRAYFSDAYDRLKQDVAEMKNSLELTHADGVQVDFERSVGKTRQLHQFWTTYCDLSPIEINTEATVRCWNSAREQVNNLLQAKQAAPLERRELDDDVLIAIADYHTHRQTIDCISKRMSGYNEVIKEIQNQADKSNLGAFDSELTELKATKARFSEKIVPLCADYLLEKQAKAHTVTKRTEARNALIEYRDNVFPQLQTGVNTYLRRFNAGFRIGNLAPVNIGSGSGSTCAYDVVINEVDIAVRNTRNIPGKATFRNTMSSGDRNTLALAVFFSSLDQIPFLTDTIVVIDDPMSSLDEQRSLTTVQEVRKLAGRTGQVIVLSHSKRFLCDVWNGKGSDECTSLEIAQNGDESTILTWNVSQDAISEHDQRFLLLKQFADTGFKPTREIAQAIRLHLEGFLRVACPGHFLPGSMLGPFINTCRQKLGGVDGVLKQDALQELEQIVEYANRFHHNTNTETINGIELRGFVKRTLAFVGPSQQ